jgi:hypothetical protein
MWLPTPIYERIPQFWLLLGLLFMSSGTYLGFDYALSFVYFGVGFVCCVWGLWVYSMRLRTRQELQLQQKQERQQQQAEQARKTEQQPGDDLNQGTETAA